jgi:hypothetical protein
MASLNLQTVINLLFNILFTAMETSKDDGATYDIYEVIKFSLPPPSAKHPLDLNI